MDDWHQRQVRRFARQWNPNREEFPDALNLWLARQAFDTIDRHIIQDRVHAELMLVGAWAFTREAA